MSLDNLIMYRKPHRNISLITTQQPHDKMWKCVTFSACSRQYIIYKYIYAITFLSWIFVECGCTRKCLNKCSQKELQGSMVTTARLPGASIISPGKEKFCALARRASWNISTKISCSIQLCFIGLDSFHKHIDVKQDKYLLYIVIRIATYFVYTQTVPEFAKWQFI